MDPATHLCGDGQEAQCVSEIAIYIEQLAVRIGNDLWQQKRKRSKNDRIAEPL
jgi:hypothetical protein